MVGGLAGGPGEIIDDRYRLDERIAAGGVGQVWLARDLLLERPVAVKLLRPEFAEHPTTLERFRKEATLAGALSHPCVAQVYDYGHAGPGGPPYLVMEFVDGPSLADLLAVDPVEPAFALNVIAQAASGLGAAHAIGLVHRDVKPENILISPDGLVKITDFGIAYAAGQAPITGPGLVMGTTQYLAPERIDGGPGTPASDLYALGIVLHECLTGAPPYEGSPVEVMAAHLHSPLPPLPALVPPELDTLVSRLTAKDPTARITDAGDLAALASTLRDSLWAPAGAVGVPAAGAATGAATGAAIGADRRALPAGLPTTPGLLVSPALLVPPTSAVSPTPPAPPAPPASPDASLRGGRRPVALAAGAVLAALVGAGVGALLAAGALSATPATPAGHRVPVRTGSPPGRPALGVVPSRSDRSASGHTGVAGLSATAVATRHAGRRRGTGSGSRGAPAPSASSAPSAPSASSVPTPTPSAAPSGTATATTSPPAGASPTPGGGPTTAPPPPGPTPTAGPTGVSPSPTPSPTPSGLLLTPRALHARSASCCYPVAAGVLTVNAGIS